MASPRSAGRGERGGVVDPVADHRDDVSLPLQLGDRVGLLLGQHLGPDVVDARAGGHRPGRGLVVSGQHHRVHPEPAQRGDGGGCGIAQRVGHREDLARRAVPPDDDGGGTARPDRLDVGGERR
jgi:hypothetical protein